ncbi:glycosyltransferase family 25 protein [Synechococcus sp. CBW1006]|nr:glycosyltransferase family 25 protein [Synechococcus sp. CBW1006]
MQLPRVSLCTVTHGPAGLLPLLQQQILTQTYPHELLEWVIVDNSDDSTQAFQPDPHQGLTIRYERLKQRLPLGQVRNLSHGFCSGEIIVVMNDTDYYPTGRVAHAVQRLSGGDGLMAGCNQLPVLFLPERELWLAGPFGNNQATAATWAFKRELLLQTRCSDSVTSGEEKSFLKDFTLPLVLLDPDHTILCISHNNHRPDFRTLKAAGDTDQLRPVGAALQANVIRHLRSILSRYEQAIAGANRADGERNTPKGKPVSPWQRLGLQHAWCISIEGNSQRQEIINARLAQAGLDCFFFKAITPETLPQVSTDMPVYNRPAQLACLSSHLMLFKLLANESGPNNQVFLVLEDDAILRDDFNSAAFLKQLPADWEIIQLGTNNPSFLTRLLELADHDIPFIRWEHEFWGTYGYLIKKKIARRLANRFLRDSTCLDLKKLYRPTRCVADFLIYEEAITYTACDPVVSFDCKFSSTVNDSDVVASATAQAHKMTSQRWSSH